MKVGELKKLLSGMREDDWVEFQDVTTGKIRPINGYRHIAGGGGPAILKLTNSFEKRP